MAAPVVSGAAALLLEKTPRLTPDQVKARLMKTASKTFPQSSSTYDQATGQTYVSTYDVFTVGAGYLDIVAALNNTDLATKPALSPAATFNTTTGTATPVAGSSALWGSSAMWGTSAIWGSSAMWGTSALWGSSAMWGTSVIWGDSALWGSSSNVNGESIAAGGER
jgi:serine protease AprX